VATLWDLPYNLNFASELEWVLPTEHMLHVTTLWDLPCDLNLASAITLLIAQFLALVGFSITKTFTGSFAFEFIQIFIAKHPLFMATDIHHSFNSDFTSGTFFMT